MTRIVETTTRADGTTKVGTPKPVEVRPFYFDREAPPAVIGRDTREDRDEVLSRIAEGPIHTRWHQANEALHVEIRQTKAALPDTMGNRRQRRAAAAMARKGAVAMPSKLRPVDPETLTVARGRDRDLPATGSFHG